MKITRLNCSILLFLTSSIFAPCISASKDLGSTEFPAITREGVTQLSKLKYFGNRSVPNKDKGAKINPDLLSLHGEYQSYLQHTNARKATQLPFSSENKLAHIHDGTVLIDAAASGNPDRLASDLKSLGAQNVKSFGHVVSARVPIGAIQSLGKLSSMQFVRPSYMMKNVGTVTSQGDAALRANTARSSFSVNGSGVRVGTLSDSYNCLGGAPLGVANGDLPAGVIVLEDEQGCSSGSDEGRAMMEIIHDVAPGASQVFHTAFNGMADFAQGIIDLASAGATVINDDVIYFAEPFYQDGIVAQAVDSVKAGGVAYFSAAANQGREAYESGFRPSKMFFDLGNGPQQAHDFDPGPGVDVCQQITIPVGQTLAYLFQWDQPFFSVSGGAGSKSDVDIILTDAACSQALSGSIENNLGNDPMEFFGVVNPGPTTTFGIMILHFQGPKPGLMKFVNFGSPSVTINEFVTSAHSPTSFGHNSALGGLGVGAADYLDTPAFGAPVPLVESFSSAGGSPILINKNGKKLVKPEIRQQPAITAPDGADTSFFGFDTSDAGSFPNFFGTSAAAPHAAGVAALLKDQVPSATPDQIYAALKSTATDMNDPATPGFDSGYDFGTGYGLIQADAALAALEPLTGVVHDMAVVKIKASKKIKGARASYRRIKVTIQNRSPHDETIELADLGNGVTTGLVRLNVNVIDDDGENCAPAQVTLDASRSLPATKVLRPKKKLTLFYSVLYQCSSAQKSQKDVTPGDYNHLARVDHAALDGNPDSDLVDDLCPRTVKPPFVVDPNPDGRIKDKGCGTKMGNVFGNPIVTDITR